MKVSLPHVAVAVLATLTAAGPAWAGSPIPGPLLGVGAPALALFAGGYYLIRRMRAR